MIHETAVIGQGARVGPYVVIEPGTVIGTWSKIQAHAVLGKSPKLARSVDGVHRRA